ncbi:MAG: hypothetical protein D6819_05575 [Gammaproteobacteria bacterium]|nr:MAG: hypothetical protein D6819_05575 [Gammaproteobacteria bacterium]
MTKTIYYCAWCGLEEPGQPCRNCKREGLTDVAPSMEPCAYCGSRPTWPVTWTGEDEEEGFVVYLCAECDSKESEELAQELD